jgi:methionine-rich copper-binding protein CopC
MKRILILCLTLLAGLGRVGAHAFLERADPAVGGTVQKAPPEVRIWLTENIEPGFSTVRVLDSSGREVSKRDARVDRSNQSLLRVSLSSLSPGTYKVVWRVVSVDSHLTKGTFTFRLTR